MKESHRTDARYCVKVKTTVPRGWRHNTDKHSYNFTTSTSLYISRVNCLHFVSKTRDLKWPMACGRQLVCMSHILYIMSVLQLSHTFLSIFFTFLNNLSYTRSKELKFKNKFQYLPQRKIFKIKRTMSILSVLLSHTLN